MENQEQQFEYQEQIQQQQQIQQQKPVKKDKKSILLLILLLVLVSITIGYAVLSTSFNVVGTSTIAGKWCVGPKCGTGNSACDNISTCQNPPIECPNNDCIITDCDKNSALCNCDSNSGECAGPTAIDCTQNPDKSDSTKCTCDANETCKPKAQVWLIGDSIYFRHTLNKPGDVFTFDTTYINGGSIDAKLGSFTKSTLNETAQQFLTYEVKNADGSAIETNEPLNAGASHTYRVTVTYKDVQTLPTQAQLDLINEVASGHTGASSTFTANYVQK